MSYCFVNFYKETLKNVESRFTKRIETLNNEISELNSEKNKMKEEIKMLEDMVRNKNASFSSDQDEYKSKYKTVLDE